MNVMESILMAIEAVRAQKLRSALTLLSIGIGVFAIVFSSSVMALFQGSVNSTLADLGENSFLIQRTPSISFGNTWRKYMKRKPITYDEALAFRDRMTQTDRITISNTNPAYVIKAGGTSTDPDVALIGVDEQYFTVTAASIDGGRAFSAQDVMLNHPVAIVGNDVVVKLFPNGNPLGRTITIKNQQFTIVGLLEKKGGVMGQSQDNRVLIPMPLFVKYYTWEWDRSVDITVKAYSKGAVSDAVDEAIGVMRMLRGVKPWEENTFELDTNEAMSAQFAGFSSGLVLFAWFCGGAALLVAGIGIMNMMLVTVKERTREIGVRKALGARRGWIVRQFMIESIVMCQLGGLSGAVGAVVLGMGGTAIIGAVTGTDIHMAVPWGAIVFSIGACTAIGLIFGLYPAWKASVLDPIEALRYE